MSNYGSLISSPSSSEEGNGGNQEVRVAINELASAPGIQSAILVSEEGFPMVSASQNSLEDDDELLISAMVSGIEATVKGAADRLGKGLVNHITVETERGFIVISSLGKGIILVISTHKDVKLGLLYYLVRTFGQRIAQHFQKVF